jgi:membrane protein
MASSLAYYALLSVAPLLLLAVSIAGWFLGESMARQHVAKILSTRLGDEAELTIAAFLERAGDPTDSVWGAVFGLVTLLVGASAAFSELQFAMNLIWGVTPRSGRGFWGMVRDRFMCFAMVGSVAVLLVGLLLIGGLLALIGKYVGDLPGGLTLWMGIDYALSVTSVAVLFALSYKLVPDVVIPLREVLPGAMLAAMMFALGELVLGIYLEVLAAPKPQGAAGSIVVLVIWFYYSSQILFYGAEFTKVRAMARGVRIVPRRHAIRTHAALDDPTLSTSDDRR